MAPKPLTEAELAQIRTLHTAGKNRNEIARLLKRSGSTISKAAEQLGLSFNRERIQAATEAKIIDAKARRRGIIDRLYSYTESLLLRLERDQHDMAEVSMGAVVRYTVTELPGADLHRIVSAISTATATAVKLEQVDSDGAADDARSLIGALAAGLNTAYEQLAADDGANG